MTLEDEIELGLKNAGAVIELSVIERKKLELAELEPVPGEWPNPASLIRFGRDYMDQKQFQRFIKKIQVRDLGYTIDGQPSKCWIWGNATHDKGYGRFFLGRDPEVPDARIWAYPHRIAYEHFIGIAPSGYIIDHECNVKTCCNPTHLQPQTNKENLRLAEVRRPYKRRNQYSKE